MSGVALSVPFLARLAREVPLVRYFKIEMPGTADKLRASIEAGGGAVAGPFDGEESVTLLAERRGAAVAAYGRILPLINFENRQCGLRATKTVMAAGGVIASAAVRHPLEPLHPATEAGLLELARDLDPLALRWGK